MAGVNVKMGVSGVQQFKQGMKESQAAVKTLDAELKLNEQYLKSGGDAQQYMEQKTKLLQEQIRKQTEVVNQSKLALEAMAKNGVKESSTAFQNMKQQSLAAQTQLAALQGELDGVGNSGNDAANELSGIGQQLESISKNTGWANIAEGIGKITEKMEAAGRAAWNMGKKIVQATLSGGQWADNLATTADQWKMTPEQVYRMQQTANLIDTSAETIFHSRQKLLTAMGSEKDEASMGAFAALGISDLSGTEKNIEDVFWKAGEGLMGMEDKVAQNEYAMKLFGRSWSEMIPIFKAGRQAYEETYNSWTWMGDEQFDKLGQMNDEQMKLETEWENFQHQFEAALAPALTEVMTILKDLMHEFNTYLTSEEGQQMLASLGEAVSGLFEDLKTIKPEEVMEKIKTALNAIKDGLNWLIENKDSVTTALKVIAGGFALLKVGEIASNIGRIVNGLKGLWPSGGGGGGAVATGGGGAATGGGAAAGIGAKISGALTSMFGAGSSFSMMGGLSTFGPLAALVAAGYAGAKMIDANLNDVNLNKIYGDSEGNLLDRMSPEQIALARRYQQVLADPNLSGTDIGYNLYDQLYASFEADGIENANLAMTYLEDIFRNAANMSDPDGLVAQWDAKWASTMDGMTSKSTQSADNMTSAAKGLETLPEALRTAVEGAVRDGMSGITIVINEGAVDTIGRRVGYAWGQGLSALIQ